MITALSGPQVIYNSRSSDVAASPSGFLNPDQGPSLVVGDFALMDPRVGYNVTRAGTIGLGTPHRRVLYQAPAVLAANNIAAAQKPVLNTAMTLVSTTGAGVTVLATAVQVWASGNTIPVGALALDGLPGLLAYGLVSPSTGNTKIALYDPSKAIARVVTVTGLSGSAGGIFTIAGADIYGYPMTQALTVAAGVSLTATTKAFKFIYSVTPNFADAAHNYTVGTGDVFGFPLRAAVFPETLIWWNNALITASTGFVGAVTTSPSTNVLGDVRGTYAVQDASDGTKVLALSVSIGQAGLPTAVGAFGVAQV